MIHSDANNCFFVNKKIVDNNHKFNKEINLEEKEKSRTHSISSNTTFENEITSEEEIDFNQDFFPQNKIIKMTNFLVDDWELKIKLHILNFNQQLLNLKKYNENINNKDYLNI